MGQVFLWNAVERRHVPTTEAFAHIADELRTHLPHVTGLVGAVLAGSAHYRQATRRSDIDGIAVYEPHCQDGMRKFMRSMHCAARKIHVPIHIHCIPRDMAEAGTHGIGPSFGEHLLRCAERAGGLIGKNPMQLLVHKNQFAASDTRTWLVRKWHSLSFLADRRPSLAGHELHRFLQKLLEAPVHAARKILWLEHKTEPDDSRSAVIANWRAKLADRGASDARKRMENAIEAQNMFERLLAADERYTHILGKNLDTPDRTDYMNELVRVANCTDDCLDFLAQCIRHIDGR